MSDNLTHAHFVSSDGSGDPTPVLDALAETMLDAIWLRITPSDLEIDGASALRIDLFDLESGHAAVAETFVDHLSKDGRTALRLTCDGEQASYELSRDGAAVLAGQGSVDEVSAAFAEHGFDWQALLAAADRTLTPHELTAPTEDEDDADAAADEPSADGDTDTDDEGEMRDVAHVAGRGAAVLIRGRLLALPIAMPRWPELFTFHSRLDDPVDDSDADEVVTGASGDGESDGASDATAKGDGPAAAEAGEGGDASGDDADFDRLERAVRADAAAVAAQLDGAHEDDEDDDDDDDDDDDQLAVVLLDRARADELWNMPVARVREFFELVRPSAAEVLGPLTHALEPVLGLLYQLDDEATLADTPIEDPIVYEVMAMATAVGYLVGDDLSYYDECFFPLLGMRGSDVSERAVADGLEDIEGMGVISAMTEVLPYKVPDGALLESFADGEISPLVRWAVRDDSYEGSLFLVDMSRVAEQIVAFEPSELAARAEAFRRAWHAADGDAPEDYDAYIEARTEIDQDELDMFAETLAELQMLLHLADINELELALLFYA